MMERLEVVDHVALDRSIYSKLVRGTNIQALQGRLDALRRLWVSMYGSCRNLYRAFEVIGLQPSGVRLIKDQKGLIGNKQQGESSW